MSEKLRVGVKMPNILETEALCHCGCGLRPSDTILISIQALLLRLQRKLGKPVRVILSSMARCPDHNKKVGGVPDSRHTIGSHIGDGRPDAADTRFQVNEGSAWVNLHPQWIAEEAVSCGLFGGVGYRRYLDDWTDSDGKLHKASKIVHLDCRPGPLATW